MRLRAVESCFLSPLCIAMVSLYHSLHTLPSRAFLAGVHSCAGWVRMQYSAPRFRGFLCSMHKNTRKKLRNFVQYFINYGFLGFNHNMLWISTHFTLQKAQHLVVSPNLHLGRNGVILCLHKEKQHRNTNPLSAACIHQPRWCVPCQVNNAQLKPLTCKASAQRR